MFLPCGLTFGPPCEQAEGAGALSTGLLVNKSLKKLSLAWNGLYDSGCYPIAAVIASNASLEVRE